MTNFLSSNPENAAVSSVDLVNSDDGSLRFNAESLSSYNFDGLVPNVIDTSYNANQITPGMYFVVPGEDDTLRPAVSINPNDDDPDGEMEIIYLDLDNSLRTYTCNGDDQFTVQYESWDERVLGTQGWGITAGGNALFSNVAVRGEVSAQSGDIGGWIIQNKDTDTHGAIYYDASIDIGESGAGVYVTGINTGYGTHYDTWIPEDDDEEDPLHLPSQFYIVYAPGSDPDVAGAKRPRWNSASTTFYVDGHGRFSLGNALTFDSNSGSLVVGGYASNIDLDDAVDSINSVISASIGGLALDLEEISASVDFLYNAGFVTDSDLVTTGGTIINGNNITTGIIDANLVNVSSGLTGLRGIKINSLGIFGYDSSSNIVFSINSGTGAATFKGDITGSNGFFSGTLSANSLTSGSISSLFIDGSTITGGTVQTSTGTNRVALASDELQFYGAGVKRLAVATAFNGSFWVAEFSGGIDISSGGLFVSGAQVDMPGVYANSTSGLDQVGITAAGRLRNNSSTQKIKYDMAVVSGEMSSQVDLDRQLGAVTVDPLDVLNLAVTEFSLIDDSLPTDKRLLGFIAEDVYDKFPIAATIDLEGNPRGVLDTPILAAIVSIVKQQQEIIEDLQNRVIQLESQIGG